jgi:hypothetical protein
MKVTEVVVSAGRTVSHPTQTYSNLKPQLTLKAQLGEDDDPTACVKQLQAQAEQLIEDHAKNLAEAIVEAEEIERRTKRVADLEREIRFKQMDLESERKLLPPSLPLFEEGVSE